MAIPFLCVMQSYLMLETQSSFLHQTTSIVEVILMISVTFTKRKLSLQADNSAWRHHSHNLRKRKSSYFTGIWTSVSGGIQKWWKNLSLFLGWGPKSKISKRHTLNTGEEITLCSSDGTRYSPKWRKDEAHRKKNGRILRCLKSKNGICVIHVTAKMAGETECRWRDKVWWSAKKVSWPI